MIYLFKRRRKQAAIFFASLMALQILGQPVAYALTSGPTQPEVQSFQPAGTTEMVDLFTGDFSYNIPLFELPGPNGGYPFNLSYQSGISMDQEASWVGLGWTLQPGAITRQMRGLPDEFNGDVIYTKMSIDPSVTVGLGAGANVELFGGAAELGLGFSVYQNSYKGMGYSIDGSVGFEKTTKGMTAGLGVGFSVDSKEGVSVNPSLTLGNEIGDFGLGAGYNSKEGLTNVGMSLAVNATVNGKDRKGVGKTVDTKFISSSSLSLAHPGYTPQITMPMKNINLSVTLKLGGSWWGVFGAGYVQGFYSEQWLNDDGKRVPTNAFGYMNYQHAQAADVLDVNREKDGIVTNETPNLAIPSLTYDIYSVTGQGISMMYRPLRNDYGIIHDQQMSSVSDAVGAGADVGPAAAHAGLNLNLNHSKSTSGKWEENNQLTTQNDFQGKEKDLLYEPWYFKVHGETASENATTLAAVGGDKAVRAQLTGGNGSPVVGPNLERKQVSPFPSPDNATTNRERKVRSQAIMPITNAELLSTTNQEQVSCFKVKYFNSTGSEVQFARTAPGHHFAGYTALTGGGLRYVYAIPAYNKYQEEVVFSTRKETGSTRVSITNNGQDEPNYKVTGTDNFFKKTELPPYAHSYLLTSILGPDYVDVANDGVTSDDLGYWVKFTYQKTTTDAAPYKWRDPFSKAYLHEGWKSDPRDDRASFVYGEKEMWYLARAETKSHIAVFSIAARDDGRGVINKVQNASDKGASSQKLTSIKLYTRSAGASLPIKVALFDYDYSLCPGIENNMVSGAGKLTLKRLRFEYGSSQHGSLNPYEFTYNNETPATTIPYDVDAYDRWGNFRPYPSGQKSFNHDYPYVDQSLAGKSQVDANAAAWSLKEIVLPSGGKIVVDYESDDYAYVQQKPAMQMMQLVDPYDALPGPAPSGDITLNQSNYKVRFKLEKSIAGTLTANQQKAEVLKYLDSQTGQLYFRILINLRSNGEGFQEFVTGYADIDFNAPMELEKESVSGDYLYGAFRVVKEESKAGQFRHPFSMRAWQHLRTNQPELANSGRKLQQTTDNGKRINQIKSLGGLGAQIRQMFEGFYDYCDGKGWGKTIVASKSWIRLNSPDRIKYGGGLRVKQITMKDQWDADDEGIYGQIYEYTTEDGTAVISSGVAAYEPIVGGDENALHYAKKYVESLPLRSDNNLFFEYPINESYYPGPQVGYSKVRIVSLPSAALAGKTVLNTTLPGQGNLFPAGTGISYGTSGMTIHEFYTAKDFPVITDETDKAKKQFKLSVPVLFLGTISATKLSASQGYSIITNDMHGRAKKVSNYRQDKSGVFEPEPISWIKYNYLSEQTVYDKTRVSVLQNALKDNGDGTLSVPTPQQLADPGVTKYHLGQETEFFHDMRQFEDNAWSGGARGNLDIVYIPLFAVVPIPIPTVWPSIGKSSSQLRTAVSNKVIFRSGILESIEAFDGGSLVKTNNLKWDKVTGNVVLTSVNNNFDNPVFTYTRPAYLEYQGMGAASQNLGLTFAITAVQQDPDRNELYQFYTSLDDGVLFPGDEILLYDSEGDMETPVTKVIYTGRMEGDDMLYTEQVLTETEYDCMIVRSGYRNQLTVAAGSITALQDPSVKGTEVTYTKTIRVPK